MTEKEIKRVLLRAYAEMCSVGDDYGLETAIGGLDKLIMGLLNQTIFITSLDADNDASEDGDEHE